MQDNLDYVELNHVTQLPTIEDTKIPFGNGSLLQLMKGASQYDCVSFMMSDRSFFFYKYRYAMWVYYHMIHSKANPHLIVDSTMARMGQDVQKLLPSWLFRAYPSTLTGEVPYVMCFPRSLASKDPPLRVLCVPELTVTDVSCSNSEDFVPIVVSGVVSENHYQTPEDILRGGGGNVMFDKIKKVVLDISINSPCSLSLQEIATSQLMKDFKKYSVFSIRDVIAKADGDVSYKSVPHIEKIPNDVFVRVYSSDQVYQHYKHLNVHLSFTPNGPARLYVKFYVCFADEVTSFVLPEGKITGANASLREVYDEREDYKSKYNRLLSKDLLVAAFRCSGQSNTPEWICTLVHNKLVIESSPFSSKKKAEQHAYYRYFQMLGDVGIDLIPTVREVFPSLSVDYRENVIGLSHGLYNVSFLVQGVQEAVPLTLMSFYCSKTRKMLSFEEFIKYIASYFRKAPVYSSAEVLKVLSTTLGSSG